GCGGTGGKGGGWGRRSDVRLGPGDTVVTGIQTAVPCGWSLGVWGCHAASGPAEACERRVGGGSRGGGRVVCGHHPGDDCDPVAGAPTPTPAGARMCSGPAGGAHSGPGGGAAGLGPATP